MNAVKLLLLSALFTGVAAAQPRPRDAASRGDPVETYLKQKQDEFAASERASGAMNLGGAVTSLYNLLRDKGPYRNTNVVGRNPDEQDRVRDALVRTTAYYLASANMGPADVTRLERAGLDPLASATAVLTGRPRLVDALVVSEIAVLAKVTANGAGSGAGPSRRLHFTPVRAVKGSAPAAAFTMDVGSPHPPSDAQAGETYLLFLSPTQAKFKRAAGRITADPVFNQQIAPLKVEGDQLVPTMPGFESMQAPVSQLDALVNQYGQAFGVDKGGAK